MLFGKKKEETSLISGPVLPRIISFVLPLMLTNLLQVCYSAADMIVVGMSDVEGAIGAIGTTNAMINLILNLFIGFSVGGNVLVARYIGMNDEKRAEKAVHCSVTVSAIAGILCAIAGLFISRPALALLGDEGHILDLAVIYTNYYFAGVPFLATANCLIAIFRAKGDTKTPLFVLTATGLLNVILNLFFVVICKMSVDGVALATVMANASSAIILALILMRDNGICRLSLKKLGIDKESLSDIFRIGIPAGVQGALFSLSNMIIQSSIISLNNTYCPGGSDIIDGNAAASSIEGFAYTATNSVCQASITFTSQNYGAGKYKRIGKIMGGCYFTTAMVAFACSAIIVLFKEFFIGLYIDSPLAVEAAITRVKIMIIPYFLLALMEVGSGVVRGFGYSMLSTVVSLIGSCVLRIIWIVFVFNAHPSLEIVYLSYPLSWGVTAMAHFICAYTIRRRLMKKYPESE